MADRTKFMQPPASQIKHPFRDPPLEIDNPAGNFRDSEVQGMNADHRAEMQFWIEEHR